VSEALDIVHGAQEWQKLCVLEDKLRRCLLCIPGASIGRSDARIERTAACFVKELLNKRQWSPCEHPEWLALEVLERIEIRENQYHVAKHLLDNLSAMDSSAQERGAIVQLTMGEGKTRVILPMLITALSCQPVQRLVRVNVLGALLPDAVAYYFKTLTGVQLKKDSTLAI
jgi:hypothetical protein